MNGLRNRSSEQLVERIARLVEAAGQLQAQGNLGGAAEQVEQAMLLCPDELRSVVFDTLAELYIAMRDFTRLSNLYASFYPTSPYSPTATKGALMIGRASELGLIATPPAMFRLKTFLPDLARHLRADQFSREDLIVISGLLSQLGETALAIELLERLIGRGIWTQWALERLAALCLGQRIASNDLEESLTELARKAAGVQAGSLEAASRHMAAWLHLLSLPPDRNNPSALPEGLDGKIRDFAMHHFGRQAFHAV
ncbi:MAG: hypothetical protein M0T84_11510 [Betaproteobacteria bacterium]|nr:hypothetical protein [Betaproteobacteria bacterium]